MTDRLERIREELPLTLVTPVGDTRWLIAEVDRLRAELAAARDSAFTEARVMITEASKARLDEIDEDYLHPSDWERHEQWCSAADVLKGAAGGAR